MMNFTATSRTRKYCLILPVTRLLWLLSLLIVLAVPSISQGANCTITVTDTDLISSCGTTLADGDAGRVIGIWKITESNGQCDHTGLTISTEAGNQFDFANEAVNLKLFYEGSETCSPSTQIGSTIADPAFSGGTESFSYSSQGVSNPNYFIVTVDDDTGDGITDGQAIKLELTGGALTTPDTDPSTYPINGWNTSYVTSAETTNTVSASGTQTATLQVPSTDQYVGGMFVIAENTGSRNVTGITITENGSVDASADLDNIRLYYELDTSDPYDCAGETYGGSETQFGSTDTDGFSAADGTSSFTDSVGISTTATMCVYVVLDIGSGATNSETLEIKINNPASDVTVSSGVVRPDTAVEISQTTALSTPFVIFYRSVGTGGTLYNTGTASCSASTTVTFSGTLPANVGTGDKLTIDVDGTPETGWVLNRDGINQVTLQSALTGTYSGQDFQIERAYASLSAWEDDRDNQYSENGYGNLVTSNASEWAVCYKDGVMDDMVTIDGWTTGPNNYIKIWVPPSQRHNGTADSGSGTDNFVVKPTVDATDGWANIFNILVSFVRVEGVEIDGSNVSNGGNIYGVYGKLLSQSNEFDVRVDKCLIHDFETTDSGAANGSRPYGIWMEDSSAQITNNIIYDMWCNNNHATSSAKGMKLQGGPFEVYNNTVYNITNGSGASFDGIHLTSGSTGIATNNYVGGLSGTGTARDFQYYDPVTRTNNFSEDTTGQVTGVTAYDDSPACPGAGSACILFESIDAGTEDFHLRDDVINNDALNAGTDQSSSFTWDMDGEIRPTGAGTWDIGADELEGVTAVELVWFGATGHCGSVELGWETASELDNLGFHVYRSITETGLYERITQPLIPGLGSSPAGGRYQYVDSGLSSGVTYFYKLEDIETNGASELHGPVSASPQCGGGSGETPSEPPTESALITYGDPSGNRLRLLSQDGAGVTLELVTEGFRAAPQQDGTVRLEVAGLEVFESGDAAAIPVKRTWVEALAGRKVQLVSVEAHEVEAIEGLRPMRGERPEIEASRRGTVRAARRRTKARSFLPPGLYPEQAAQLLSVGFQGEVKKALVEMAPLRWDGSTGRLMLTRRLVVRLAFGGREPGESVLDGRRGRRPRMRKGYGRRRVVARLATVSAGLYGIGFDEVFGRTRSGLPAEQIRLSRQGEAVAFHILPNPGTFQAGSTLYFASEGANANPYGGEAVYELQVGVRGETMPVVSAPPAGEASGFYRKRLEEEENRLYMAGLVEAPDVWLWELVMSSATKSYPFEVDRLSLSDVPSRLTVWLQGTSDFPKVMDHHVRVYVNGTWVGEQTWDGKQARRIDAELPPALLREGTNTLEIENVGDSGASYSMVMLDRYRVDYPRHPVAEEGKLEGSWSRSGVAEVSALGTDGFVVDRTEKTPAWVVGVEVGAEGVARFRAEAGRQYLVVGDASVLHPEVRRPLATGLRSKGNEADYLVIAPQEFLSAAEPLVSLRSRQGLRVKMVSTEAIFSEFGFGETTPQAIQDLLAYAYHFWQAPSVKYVLLVGDATYDYKDFLKTGVKNQVPPLMAKTSYLWTVSDPLYAAVNGEDALPDLAIGRLPAADVEELQNMVAKIVAFETTRASLDGRVVLVTDNPDEAGDFQADAEELSRTVLSTREVTRIYLGETGSAGTRDAIRTVFDEGMSLMSYIGHGGIHLWADENVLNIYDVPNLSRQSEQPLLLTMNCLNGYFHFPYFDALSEALLKAEGKGVVAAFSPSGLSQNGPAHRFHKALLKELLLGHHDRLGDAVLAAQEAYAETGAFPELLSIYHLFGDPAMRLGRPD